MGTTSNEMERVEILTQLFHRCTLLELLIIRDEQQKGKYAEKAQRLREIKVKSEK